MIAENPFFRKIDRQIEQHYQDTKLSMANNNLMEIKKNDWRGDIIRLGNTTERLVAKRLGSPPAIKFIGRNFQAQSRTQKNFHPRTEQSDCETFKSYEMKDREESSSVPFPIRAQLANSVSKRQLQTVATKIHKAKAQL